MGMLSISGSSLTAAQICRCVDLWMRLCAFVWMLSVSFCHLQRRWGITVHPVCPVTSPSATSFLSRMKPSCLKWRICIHSTSNSDRQFITSSFHWKTTGFLCSWFSVLYVMCVCMRSQGAEAERGRAVFPQHSTNAGVVWSGAACCHGGVIPSI